MVDKLAWVLVGIVAFVWTTTTLVLPFLIHGYTPPPSVGTVMGSLAGGAAAYLFARRSEHKNGNGNGEKHPPRPKKPGAKP